MGTVTLNEEGGPSFTCDDGEPILRAGLRAGIGMPYECGVGGCGTCKVQVLDGEVEMLWAEAPALSDRDRKKNRVLACQATCKGNARIRVHPDPACEPVIRPTVQGATLTARRSITADIEEFSVQTDGPADFLAGQYALLSLPGIAGDRAYSMSNLPNDDGIWEFQIRRVPGGSATSHLFDAAKVGDRMRLDGPYGMAFLRDTGRDVVCIAGGSGLAPMISISRRFAADPAFADRSLTFLYGARTPADVCGQDMLELLPGYGARLTYVPVVSDAQAAEDAGWQGRVGFVHDHIGEVTGGGLSDREFYFAGPPAMSTAIEDLLTGAGEVPAGQIHFDRFF